MRLHKVLSGIDGPGDLAEEETEEVNLKLFSKYALMSP